MPMVPFGNDPAKVDRYKAFWSRDDVKRPLVRFSFAGWFPLRAFAACRSWRSSEYLTPDMIAPGDFVDDHIRLLREGERVDDDVFRGACPMQVAVPFLPAVLGCPLRTLPDNVLCEELHLSWDEASQVRLDRRDPWLTTYLDFAQALVTESRGRFPVSHAPDLGPTDLHAFLRGYGQSVLDLVDDPQRSAGFLWHLGEIVREFTEELWKRVPRFLGGYFDAQYSLWSPGPIVRMQEDATAVYSPDLYRRCVQPVDRMLAGHFASSFIHLHSTSMFLLEAFLEIREIQCFEINKDASGPTIRQMVPYYQMVQEAGKPLLIHGAFTPDEVRVLMDSLEPRGLFLSMMVDDMDHVESLRPLVGM
jgi:hypothetical protein